jgi:hypothetical protein
MSEFDLETPKVIKVKKQRVASLQIPYIFKRVLRLGRAKTLGTFITFCHFLAETWFRKWHI